MAVQNHKRRSQYMSTLRLGAAISALFVWWVSVQFSAAGFSINLPEYRWIGYGLAFVATILQLIFNKGVAKNPTLFFAGIIAYVYGIYTNFLGMTQAGIFNGDPFGIGFLSVLIEVLPEAMFLWSWLNEGQILGDFLTSLFAGTNLRTTPPPVGFAPQNRVSSPSVGVPDVSGLSTDEEKRVLQWARRNAKNGNFPSVREVASHTGVSKTKVAEILRPHRK